MPSHDAILSHAYAALVLLQHLPLGAHPLQGANSLSIGTPAAAVVCHASVISALLRNIAVKTCKC
jgi:hypothetical protein